MGISVIPTLPETPDIRKVAVSIGGPACTVPFTRVVLLSRAKPVKCLFHLRMLKLANVRLHKVTGNFWRDG